MFSEIPEETIKDFNEKMDKNRKEMMDFAGSFRASNPTETKGDYVFSELMNRMEIARRVFNHYAQTGEIKVPD